MAVMEQDLKTVKAELNKQPKFKINIHSTKDEQGPVDITVNGHNYHILRDNDVTVPESVLEVLNNAVVAGMRFDEAQGRAVPHNYKRFSFSSSPTTQVSQGK